MRYRVITQLTLTHIAGAAGANIKNQALPQVITTTGHRLTIHFSDDESSVLNDSH
jgi:hypothetical protein